MSDKAREFQKEWQKQAAKQGIIHIPSEYEPQLMQSFSDQENADVMADRDFFKSEAIAKQKEYKSNVKRLTAQLEDLRAENAELKETIKLHNDCAYPHCHEELKAEVERLREALGECHDFAESMEVIKRIAEEALNKDK